MACWSSDTVSASATRSLLHRLALQTRNLWPLVKQGGLCLRPP